MSKERLEEIEDVIHSWLAWKDWNKVQRETLNDILKYLKQAERIPMLEKQYETRLRKFLELDEQNKRYREAIYNAERKCDGEASSILKLALLEGDEG